ncbi:MAG TPA: GvpL/GvpF family gas vesicle protein [Segeticoccus sp.]|nr:GvpL/GvpF family gas vesicle protein [Segeticoccus sp.]
MPQTAPSPSEAAGLLVHGVVPAETTLPDTGDDGPLAGHPLSLVRHGRVAVVVEPVEPERTFRAREDLLAHSEMLNALAAAGPVVPIAFGSILRDEAAVRAELVEPHEEDLADRLAGLSGRAQFTLRARYIQDQVLTEVVTEEPEIARLREQTRDQPEEASHGARVRLGELVGQAVATRRQRDLQMLLELLAPVADDHQVTEGTGLDDLADVSFLLAADRRAEFEERAEELAQRWSERARLKLLGPLAPYDFVGELDRLG